MLSFRNKLLLRSNSSSPFILKKYLQTSLIRFVARIIDGKDMAKKIISETKQEVHEWVDGGHKRPTLAVVKVGVPEGEGKYTQSVLKACKDIGIEVKKFEFPEDIREVELLADIRKLNDDLTVDAIMLEFPLPNHITERIMCNAVAPHKDVNGFNIVNVGRLTQQMTTIVPCMAAAIKEIIKRIGIPTVGKSVVICGRSQKIGLPIANISCFEETGEVPGLGATVTICHRNTPKDHLTYLIKNADILISACGIPGLIDASMLKSGACVIDVGSVIVEDEKAQKIKLVADLDFEEMKKVASFITPVPGGVGSVAIAMTMKNIMALSKRTVEYDVFEPGAALYHALANITP